MKIMKNKFYRRSKRHDGVVFLESLLALAVISFAVIYFYHGSLQFLMMSEQQQRELQQYRVLYEEISKARNTQQKSGAYSLTRGGKYQINYQLETLFYVESTEENQHIRIERFP